MALAGHDPQRTLERGYVLASTAGGEPVVSASQAPAGEELRLRFADGVRDAMILDR
jgi:exodeoxyribonuclease VII large subunit